MRKIRTSFFFFFFFFLIHGWHANESMPELTAFWYPSQRQQMRYTLQPKHRGGLYWWQFAWFARKTSRCSDLLCMSVTRLGVYRGACRAILLLCCHPGCWILYSVHYSFNHIHRNEPTEEHNGTCLHSLSKMIDNEGSSLTASSPFIHLHNTTLSVHNVLVLLPWPQLTSPSKACRSPLLTSLPRKATVLLLLPWFQTLSTTWILRSRNRKRNRKL